MLRVWQHLRQERPLVFGGCGRTRLRGDHRTTKHVPILGIIVTAAVVCCICASFHPPPPSACCCRCSCLGGQQWRRSPSSLPLAVVVTVASALPLVVVIVILLLILPLPSPPSTLSSACTSTSFPYSSATSTSKAVLSVIPFPRTGDIVIAHANVKYYNNNMRWYLGEDASGAKAKL
jgi:hypothetical protein